MSAKSDSRPCPRSLPGLRSLDEWFRLHHGLRKQELRRRLLAGHLPVLIRVSDRLVFLHRRQRSSARILDEIYHGYKAVCHVPVALFLWARQCETDEALLDGEVPRRALVRLREELRREADRLHSEHLREGPSVASILGASEALVASLLERGSADAHELEAFERRVRSPIARLLQAATRHELTRLHRVVTSWTSDLDANAWRSLRVVICAGHQARYKQSTKQYFQRLLGEHESRGAEGERQIIYAENTDSEDAALDLLATHVLDREIGAFFLGSPLAMQQDLLGEAASMELDSIFSPTAAGRE